MAGTQPALGSTTVAAMTSSSMAAAAAGASGSARLPAQILTELLEALATLMPPSQNSVGCSLIQT